MRRRTLLTGLAGLTFFPSATLAAVSGKNKPKLPSCSTSKTVGRWKVYSSIEMAKDKPMVQSNAIVSSGYKASFQYQDTVFRTATLGEVHVDTNTKRGSKLVVVFPRGRLPDGTDITHKFYSKDFFSDDHCRLNIEIDGEAAAEVRAPLANRCSMDLTPTLIQQMLAGKNLHAEVDIDGKRVATLDVHLRKFSDALEVARTQMAELGKTVMAAKGCEKRRSRGCIMTSAAVDMLGREDDCFELSQMRKLRSRFGHEEAILQDYLETGDALLRHEADPRFRAILFAFYLFIVWPTALITKLGGYALARGLYLAGFSVFKRISFFIWRQ